MRSILIESIPVEPKVHLIHLILLAIRQLEQEESGDMLHCTKESIEAEAKSLVERLQGQSKTDVWCNNKLQSIMTAGPRIPLFMKTAIDLFYYAATNTGRGRSQLFFTLFLEFANLGLAERHLLWDGLDFFQKSVTLLRCFVPQSPDSLPTFAAPAPVEEDDEPDEKDIVPYSGFSALYEMKSKKAVSLPKEKGPKVSTLNYYDMVYLFETLTVIAQNAVLPPYEPPPKNQPTGKKTASKGKGKGEPATKAPAKAPASASAAAAAAAAPESESASASASAAAEDYPPSHAVVSKADSDVYLHADQIRVILDDLFPEILKSNSGMYCLKRFAYRMCSANRFVIEQMTAMFRTFLSAQHVSYSQLKRYAELVNYILSIKDGATESRAHEYMTFHLGFIAERAASMYSGSVLRNPLETLAMIVNNGGKEMKAIYKKLAFETEDPFFTDIVLKNGRFKSSI